MAKVRLFLKEREWEKFQNPKDLAESVCIEPAELLQLFQWIAPAESEKFKQHQDKLDEIERELADVVIYCLSLANTLGIDLATAVRENRR